MTDEPHDQLSLTASPAPTQVDDAADTLRPEPVRDATRRSTTDDTESIGDPTVSHGGRRSAAEGRVAAATARSRPAQPVGCG